MKAILPILICSAISAGLGYYFGHITVPASSQTATAQASANTPPTAPAPAYQSPAAQPAPAYQPPAAQPAPTYQPTAAQPQPATSFPVAGTPTPAPAPVAVETPSAENAAFAARAAQPMQTLTDTQGRTIQANIVQVTASDVKIRRSDGLETTIPLTMLSADDIAFCNYIREQQVAKPQTSPSPAIKADDFDWDAYFNS